VLTVDHDGDRCRAFELPAKVRFLDGRWRDPRSLLALLIVGFEVS
jgi:hypothetical protein